MSPLSPDAWKAASVWVSPEQRAAFEQRLTERPPAEGMLGDVALAFAAAGGHPQAISRVEKLVREARPVVARVGAEPDFLDDLHQLAMTRLFTGARPRLWDYAGLGSLAAWVRAIVVRLAIDERRRTRELPDDELGLFLEAHLGRAEPLRTLTSQRVAAAVRAALTTLPARDRTLLRLHHLEGVTLDALAAMYSVHRATIARWLSEARALVQQQTRLELTSQLGGDELAVALESVLSALEVSFRQLFDRP